MKNLLILATMLITFGFANAQTNCSGHENDIKNGQIKKALSMNMTVKSIIVKYLGNCQYMCISDVDDPGTAYSAAQKLNTNTIFKWENNKYVFVRKGKTICDCLKDDGTNKKECDDLGNRLSKAEIDSEIDKCGGTSNNKSNNSSTTGSSNKMKHRCGRTWNGERDKTYGVYGDYCCERCYVDFYPN